jgi:deoxycitidine kinase/deoxyguanosine kinase
MVRIYSVDGNIGAGKTTFLEAVRTAVPGINVILEPVGEWLRLKHSDGRSLLELFYADKKRWAYTFQNCAILTRLNATLEALRALPADAIILTERSVLTDRYVFADMLRASGDLDSLEWELYCKWFDAFAVSLPIEGIIYLSTDFGTAAQRIVKRARSGEERMSCDYLIELDAQHRRWVGSTKLPVLEICTDTPELMAASMTAVADFVTGGRPKSVVNPAAAFMEMLRPCEGVAGARPTTKSEQKSANAEH